MILRANWTVDTRTMLAQLALSGRSPNGKSVRHAQIKRDAAILLIKNEKRLGQGLSLEERLIGVETDSSENYNFGLSVNQHRAASFASTRGLRSTVLTYKRY